MKNMMILTTLSVLSAATITGQSGGQFSIEKSVIAGGGGISSGGTFTANGTIGQSVAGNVSGGPYSVKSGFWTPAPLAPTAATVSVSGRIVDAAGSGLRNVSIMLTDAAGVTLVVRSNAFGYFVFNDVMSGQTYLVNMSARGRQFVPQILSVNDSVTGLEFRSLN